MCYKGSVGVGMTHSSQDHTLHHNKHSIGMFYKEGLNTNVKLSDTLF